MVKYDSTVEELIEALWPEPIWIVAREGKVTITTIKRIYGQGDVHDVEIKTEGSTLKEAVEEAFRKIIYGRQV